MYFIWIFCKQFASSKEPGGGLREGMDKKSIKHDIFLKNKTVDSFLKGPGSDPTQI